VEKTNATSQNLIQLINMMPDELLKASMTGANERWITQKVNTIKHSQKLPLIDTKSVMWKKITGLDIGSPLILPGIPEIKTFNDISALDAWAGFMEITESKITTYLNEDLGSAGVIFQDVASAIANDDNRLEKSLQDSLENSAEKIESIAQGTADHGFYLSVPAGICIEKPFKVSIKLTGTASIMALNLVTILGDNSNAKVILELIPGHINKNRCFLPVTFINSIGNNSELEMVEFQDLSESSLFFPNEMIEIGGNAVLNRFILDKGSQVTHRKFSVDLKQRGGKGTITGTYFPKDEQTFLYDTLQNHTASNTTSNLLFKGVLDDAAYTLWKGNINVSEGIHGADGYQLSNTLLLDPATHAKSIPGLEISTDDVKCSHGVTISSVDKDQLFYLKTRGISESDGKKLIVDGFIRSAVSRIKNIELQEYIKEKLGDEGSDL
jgi:Fe-S cluster assembly protein SufD